MTAPPPAPKQICSFFKSMRIKMTVVTVVREVTFLTVLIPSRDNNNISTENKNIKIYLKRAGVSHFYRKKKKEKKIR